MPRSLFAIGLALFAVSAAAVEYGTLVPERSQLRFTSKQMGVPVDGSFKKLSGTVSFDPDKPAASTAQIQVDLASVDAGSADANEEVKGKGWFNLREFPVARFVVEAGGVRAVGNGRYEAKGKISIKGVTREVTVPFYYRIDRPNAVLDGMFQIQRSLFGVGDGPWADTSVVADEVPLRFNIVLAPKSPAK